MKNQPYEAENVGKLLSYGYLFAGRFSGQRDFTQPSYGRNHFCWADYSLGQVFGNYIDGDSRISYYAPLKSD